MELMQASNQWMTRPKDERFASLQALHGHCLAERALSRASETPTRLLNAVAVDGAVKLANLARPAAQPAALTHWAFGQLAGDVGAPAPFLRSLPAELAAQCVNVKLHEAGQAGAGSTTSVLVRSSATQDVQDAQGAPHAALTVRALTSDKYTRIWNADITERLVALEARGPWQPAPAGFDGSRGLYAGDRDMFAFLVDSGRRIFEKDPGGGLSRGFFVWNSEVGAATFGMLTFLYEYVCGNHIVWGAQGVKELRLRHVGKVDQRAWGALAVELRRYAESSAQDDEARIVSCQRYTLGGTKDEVLDKVFGLRIPALTKAVTREALELAETRTDRYGSPYSAWGFANGVTEISQKEAHAGARVELDRAAGKVLELAF